MLTLYPHQQELFNASRIAAGLLCRSILVQAPTGAGKTAIGSAYAASAVAKRKRVIFSVHRDFLVDQTSQAFDRAGLAHSIIAAGHTPDYSAPAIVASIGSLMRRLDVVQHTDLLIVDECHHAIAATWLNVIEHFKSRGAYIVGLSATPWRMNGAGLGMVYEKMICGPTVRWLIDNKYLSEFRAFAPSTPDLSGVHTRAGDYVREELAAVAVTGDAVSHYQKITPGQRALAFCVSVEHSRSVTESFNAAGIAAEHIDATTPKDKRAAKIEAFRAGRTRVLCSVEIFGEGFDSPACDAVILLRPTKSLALHLQQIGRGMRVAEGKERLTILDAAGNIARLGFPDDVHDWTLEGGVAKEKVASVTTCPECFASHRPAASCPECGCVYPVAKQGREVASVEGELAEITRKAAAKQELREAGADRQKLEKLAKARGYDLRWVDHRLRFMGAWRKRA